MANTNEQIASEVLKAVGGKENITNVAHCMTRLRFNLKDMGYPDEAQIKSIKGVLGATVAGGQFQVIIGQNVPKVYDALCKEAGIQAQEAINENLDGPKEKLTPKKIGSIIMNYLSGSMSALIPVMMAAGMFKTICVLLGPTFLNILSEESHIYMLCDFVYDAGFYFIPIYVGYTAAKKLGMNPLMGMYMGGILIAPDLIDIVAEGTSFTVFGIPMSAHNYSSTILPILLSVPVMYYVEKFFKKVMPTALSTIFTPTLTVLVMLPVSLCVLAPAGYVIGDGLAVVLNLVADYGGFVGIAIIAGLWEYLVMTGMHGVLLMPAMAILMAGGSDPVFFVAAKCATFAAYGMALGTFLRMKNKEEKATNLGFFISGIIGGVTEPVLYGTGFKYKRPFIFMSIGAAIGGAYNGITGVVANLFAASNVLGVLAYSGGTTANFVNGTIGCFTAMIASTILVFLFGYSKTEIETGQPDVK